MKITYALRSQSYKGLDLPVNEKRYCCIYYVSDVELTIASATELIQKMSNAI